MSGVGRPGGARAALKPERAVLLKCGIRPEADHDEGPELTVLPIFSPVVLNQPYNHNGLSLPAGATGVVTDVLPQFKAYIVEFGPPHTCVETVALWMVKPTKG